MKAAVIGLRARIQRVNAWIEEEEQEAKLRRLSSLTIDEKYEMLRELLPCIPPDHPARAMGEELLARREQRRTWSGPPQ